MVSSQHGKFLGAPSKIAQAEAEVLPRFPRIDSLEHEE